MVSSTAELPLSTGEEESTKRRQIIEGARKVFLDLGFDGASMGEIARAAGVSKGTLYVYFTDKSCLFEAIVEHQALEQGRTHFDLDPGRPLEAALLAFGKAYIELVCRPDGGSTVRTVMAIAERMPEVGRRFYNNVIAHTAGRFADFLRAKAAAGELVIPDFDLAAMQFMMTCQATLFQPYIFQARPAPTAEEIDKVAASATRMFLAAYAPPRG